MHICIHASGGRVGLNCSAGRLKLLVVTIDVSVVDLTISPARWNPLGGWGVWEPNYRGVDAGRVRYPLTEGTGSDVCSQTPHIYVQFYIYYMYVWSH